MADTSDNALFREINEELQQEKLVKFWKKYGSTLIVVAVAMVAGVGAYQGWQAYDLNNRTEDGEKFAQARDLLKLDRPDQSIAAFAALSSGAGTGYAMLARFQQAAKLASTDQTKATALYNGLATDTGIDVIYRDLAVILGVMIEMDTGNADDLSARLVPLLAEDNPWRHNAREMTAILSLGAGDIQKARQLLTEITADATVQPGVKSRATELLASLGQ